MKILVTGCAGYVGSVLTPYLLGSGHHVTGLDSLRYGGAGLLPVWSHPRFRFVQEDVTTPAAWDEVPGHDVVIHLAAIVGERACDQAGPDLAHATNVLPIQPLLEAAQRGGVQAFILASTCSNYGVVDANLLATEDSPLKPLGLYAETKVAAEQLVLQETGVRTQVLRFATAFGVSPRMRFDTILNEWVRGAVLHRRLDVYNLDAWRPLCHVRDIARAIVYFAERTRATKRLDIIVNVGGFNWTKHNLVRAICVETPGLVVQCQSSGPGDNRDYRVSFQRAEATGFSPVYTVERGIREVATAVRAGLFGDPDAPQWRNA